ncbi:MAG TPA: deoxyribodipyrimidine photolyase [Planctomycetota bacterium]|nr:deoxyribodipyrimidine photolyase [Planctomycetota bacterium]
MSVPGIRIEPMNGKPVRADGRYVLYWMIAARRTTYNFGLERAAEIARELSRPLLVFEALRCDHPWASDRIHAAVLRGMEENKARCAKAGVGYLPYVEAERGAGRGLLEALAGDACAVVTDDFPCFFLPDMVAAAARKLPVKLEAVDSNGLLPLRVAETDFPTAYAFRRFLQKELPVHLSCMPAADPLKGLSGAAVPEEVRKRWPPEPPPVVSALPIDHAVAPVALPAARNVLARFVGEKLAKYGARDEPDEDVTSGLSPYLHFGHISAHEVFLAVAERENWKHAGPLADGKREGWWGMSAEAEAFLDQLVTWRELGFNMCSTRDDYDRFESLPDWALRTLEKHERDPRERTYTLEELAQGKTHDPLWNAAQAQLAREGRIHNYLRMLWGKKILAWTATPRVALSVMVELNNRFALDGRDPNSYAGIFWCLGRYDRPWGPERPVFGTVRYMSSENTARKHRVKEYVRRYGGPCPTASS